MGGVKVKMTKEGALSSFVQRGELVDGKRESG